MSFVLESIWSVYEAVMVRRDKEMTAKILTSLNITLLARDARQTDPRVQLQAMMSQWLPVSTAALGEEWEKLGGWGGLHKRATT